MKKYFSLAILAAATSALAAPQENGEFFNTKDEALKAVGLDIYESAKNAEIIQNASSNVKDIPTSAYSGTWLEYDENNDAIQVIAVKSLLGVKKSASPTTRYVFVKYSTEDLESIRKEIWNLFPESKINSDDVILGIAINDEKNSIAVRTRKEDADFVNQIINANIKDSSVVTMEVQDGPLTLYRNLYGGEKIASFWPNSANTPHGYACTAGFNVLVDGIYQAVVTAAHCFRKSTFFPEWSSVYFNNSTSATSISKGEYIGEYLADAWPQAKDAILFGNVSHVHTTFPQIYGSANQLRYVKDLAGPIINSNVCTFGGSSKWRCGSQKSINSQVFIDYMEFTFSEASVCGAGGDSGGPVVNGNLNALGVYTGTLGNYPNGTCGATVGGVVRPNSIYQPLGPYLSQFPNVKLRIN